jgi:hypothetical protein
MSPSPVLPDAAREQAWRLLWAKLLAPSSKDPEAGPEPSVPEQGPEPSEDDPRSDDNTDRDTAEACSSAA